MTRRPEFNNLLGHVEQPPNYDIGDGYSFSDRNAAQSLYSIPRKPVESPVEGQYLPDGSTHDEYLSKSKSSSEWQPSGNGDVPHWQEGNIWVPGFWQQFPYRGALAILACIGFIIASIVVLVKSEGAPVSSWTVSPSVYLAFFMAVTNMLARFAFKEGVKIAWWCKALRGGTIKELHNQWGHADSFWSALFAGRHFNLVTMGTIAVTIMVMDQPLIQRASSVTTIQQTSIIEVIAPIAPEIPWGFTGRQAGRDILVQLMTPPMISAFTNYNSQAPIVTGFTGCKDNCTGYIESGGLSARCNTTSGPIVYDTGTMEMLGKATSLFSAAFELGRGSQPQMIMNIAYTSTDESDPDCATTRTERTCYLASATLRYPVTLSGNILTIGDILGKGTTQSFQPISNNGNDAGADSFYTLGGLFTAAEALFSSNATSTFSGARGNVLSIPDRLSNQFLDTPKLSLSSLNDTHQLLPFPKCGRSWRDPTSHILESLNRMALHLSLQAADFPYRNTSERPSPQRLLMEQTSNVNVYHAEYKFLIATAVLTTVFVVLILPLFIGFWDLGRSVSLNPIETGKAFDAPLLQGPGSNAPMSELLQRFGARHIRLGEVEYHKDGERNSRRQLVLGDLADVSKPTAGMVYA